MTTDEVVEILKTHGDCTREEMFGHFFGPDMLSGCTNPSAYVHHAIQALEETNQIRRNGTRARHNVWRLVDASPPLLSGLFARQESTQSSAGVESRPPEAEPAPAGAGASSEPGGDARVFLESVARAALGIGFRDTDEAVALIAGVFADPQAQLPEHDETAGWRLELPILAMSSTPERRAVVFDRFAAGSGEELFLRIVGEHQLGPQDHGRVLTTVADALAGKAAPSVDDRPWIHEAFADLRARIEVMPVPAGSLVASEVAAAPLPEAPTAHRRRSRPQRPPRATDPAEALREFALTEFSKDSPAGQLVGAKYGFLVARAFEGDWTTEDIARTVIENGLQIPFDMAVALLERLRAKGR